MDVPLPAQVHELSKEAQSTIAKYTSQLGAGAGRHAALCAATGILPWPTPDAGDYDSLAQVCLHMPVAGAVAGQLYTAICAHQQCHPPQLLKCTLLCGKQESEYAAWTLTNGWSLNHTTIAVHHMRKNGFECDSRQPLCFILYLQ